MVVIISHKQCKVAAMSQTAAMHRLYSIKINTRFIDTDFSVHHIRIKK